MTGVLAAQPAEWTRDEWLDWRTERIGGSDVAALCGLSRFASPTSVYYDKSRESSPRDVGEAAQWGLLLEGPIAREFEQRTGLHVLHAQTLAVDAAVSWRGATLDGLVAESADVALDDPDAFLGTIQIKCSSDYGWDDIPEEYTCQVQWELGVAGYEHGWLVVLHQGRKLVIYEIEFDPRVFAALCSIADRFWQEHVMARVPPPADSSDATTEALKAAFPSSDGDPVELDAQVLDAARQLPAAKQRVKDAEAEVSRIENTIRAALGDAAAGCVRGDDGELVPVVTYKAQTANRLDTAALKAAHPGIAAEFTTTRTMRVMRQTKALTEQTEGANA